MCLVYERLLALHTRETSLTLVNSTVGIQTVFLLKAFPALWAGKGTVPGVAFFMPVKMRLGRKAFPALRADKGPHPDVNVFMSDEIGFGLETLPAL